MARFIKLLNSDCFLSSLTRGQKIGCFIMGVGLGGGVTSVGTYGVYQGITKTLETKKMEPKTPFAKSVEQRINTGFDYVADHAKPFSVLGVGVGCYGTVSTTLLLKKYVTGLIQLSTTASCCTLIRHGVGGFLVLVYFGGVLGGTSMLTVYSAQTLLNQF